jgi:hypothetical protein
VRLAVDAHQLEIVDVDVEGVFFIAVVADGLLLYRVQLGLDVHPLRVDCLPLMKNMAPAAFSENTVLGRTPWWVARRPWRC